MKKVKILVGTMVLVGLLTACDAKGDKTTTVCTGVVDGIDEKLTFKANGDEIETQIEEFNLPLELLGIGEEDLDAFVSVMLTELYGSDDLEGTNGKFEVKGEDVYFTFTVDYTKTDFDELADAGFIEKGAITTKYISLEKSLESYEDQGLKCK